MTDQTDTSTTRQTLHRSRTDRKVAGVAGGLAAYFGIDPIILRILIVVLSLFGGSGLLIYAAGWLLLPDEGEQRSEVQKLLDRDGRPHSARVVIVATIVIIGVVIGVGSLFDDHRWLGAGPGIWPLLVVGGVGALIWYGRRDQAPGVPVQPPYAPAAPYPWTATAPLATPVPTTPAPPVPRRRKSVLGALTLSVAAIAAGVMLPFNLAGVWHLHAVPFLAVLLGIIGLGLVVGAFVGRSRGLIVWGILLTLVTAVASAVPAIDARGTGDVSWRPTALASVPADGYSWAAGDARLDLTALPVTGGTVSVRAQLGAGQLVVVVPDNVRLVVNTHVGLGSIVLPDVTRKDGIGRRYSGTIEPLLPPGTAAGGTLVLRLELGAGNLEVRRAQA